MGSFAAAWWLSKEHKGGTLENIGLEDLRLKNFTQYWHYIVQVKVACVLLWIIFVVSLSEILGFEKSMLIMVFVYQELQEFPDSPDLFFAYQAVI